MCVTVCDSDGGMKCSMCCVRKPPRTLAIKHSLNQQMHLKCTNKYSATARKQMPQKYGTNPVVLCVANTARSGN